MADQNPTGTVAAESPAMQDLRDQAVVLDLVLSNWPIHLTAADMEREIGATDFVDHDRISRAIRDLDSAGLAVSCCGAVLPTRAALHFSELEKQR